MDNIIPYYDNHYQKEKYFSLKIIDNEKKLREFFEKILPENYEQGGIWRGLSESKYKLYNSLQRDNIKSKKLNSVQDVIKYIESAIKLLEDWNKRIVKKYFIVNHDIEEIPIYAGLSILQHYKVQTPLLDWTINPNNALYFAIQPSKINKKLMPNVLDNFLSLYHITTNHPYYNFSSTTCYKDIYENDSNNPYINERIDFVIKHKGDKFLQDKIKQEATKEFISLIVNNNDRIKKQIERFPIQLIQESNKDNISLYLNIINKNIIAQSGLFVLNIDPYLSLEESILNRIEKISFLNKVKEENEISAKKRVKDNFICYDIHKKFIPRIKEELVRIGITEETLFPNFNKINENITFNGIIKSHFFIQNEL